MRRPLWRTAAGLLRDCTCSHHAVWHPGPWRLPRGAGPVSAQKPARECLQQLYPRASNPGSHQGVPQSWKDHLVHPDSEMAFSMEKEMGCQAVQHTEEPWVPVTEREGQPRKAVRRRLPCVPEGMTPETVRGSTVAAGPGEGGAGGARRTLRAGDSSVCLCHRGHVPLRICPNPQDVQHQA